MSSAAGRTSVEITFDEPVSLDASDPIQVRGPAGNVMPCRPAAHIDPNDATSVLCTFARPLGEGRSTVDWIVTSADTHVVHGAFSFGSAAGVAENVPASSQAPSPFEPAAPLPAVLRWIVLYATIVAVGSIVFVAFVLARDPVRNARAARRCLRLAIVCAVVGLGASLPAFAVQAIAASGGIDHVVPQTFAHVVTTRYGVAWLLRVAGLLAFVSALCLPGARGAGAAIAAGSAALASFTLSGHAGSAGGGAIGATAAIADFVHLAAAAVWAGGVAAFVIALPIANLRAAIAAFSPLAIASTIAIVWSGTFAAVVHVGSWAALTDDWYGRLVIVKAALFLVLLALGARNARGGRSVAAIGSFSQDVVAEAALFSVVLLATAVLIGLPPPHRVQPS